MKELVGLDMSRRSTFQILWEPRDLWVGVYWTTQSKSVVGDTLDIYICLLPCLPIKLQWWRPADLDANQYLEANVKLVAEIKQLREWKANTEQAFLDVLDAINANSTTAPVKEFIRAKLGLPANDKAGK